MGKGSFTQKQDRHTRLIGLLRSESYWTVEALSAELSVSSRTLSRDLVNLQESGIPIETERGRGGGIRLTERWGVNKLNLSNAEVMDMLLSFAITQTLNSSLLTKNIKSIQQKISLSFPPAQRESIRALRKRILVGSTASENVLSSYTTPTQNFTLLTDAFFNCNLAQMTYVNADNVKTKRRVEIHYLLLNWPVWYIVCWDELRQSPRVFRIDRIKKFKRLDIKFELHKKNVFEESYAEYFSSI